MVFTAAALGGAAAATHPTAPEDFEPCEILAAVADPWADPWFVPHARKLGFVPVEQVRLDALELAVVRLRTPAGRNARDALGLFRQASPSVLADVNAVLRPAAAESQGAARAIGGWAVLRSTCGAGIRLGMIDTPADENHAAFRGRGIVYRSSLTGSRGPAPAKHGTAVAALLVGDPESNGFGGLLPRATLLAANIFERRWGGRARGQLLALLKALDWLAGERVQVVNLSFETGENVILAKALETAAGHDLVLTAAAGHRGIGTGPAYPAAHPAVLSATAIDARLRAYRHAKHGDYIDFAAPGVRLWTAVPGGGAYQSGTSFAVPLVSAVAAMHIAAGLPPDSESVRRALARSARDLGAPGRDEVFGWGLIGIGTDCP